MLFCQHPPRCADIMSIPDHIISGHTRPTTRRLQQRGQHADSGGLACAILSQQRQDLAGLILPEGRNADAAAGKQIFATNCSACHNSRSFSGARMNHAGITRGTCVACHNGAQALGREKDVGAIAVGRFADIIAVDGDPLTNVRELESVDAVVKSGKLID